MENEENSIMEDLEVLELNDSDDAASSEVPKSTSNSKDEASKESAKEEVNESDSNSSNISKINEHDDFSKTEKLQNNSTNEADKHENPKAEEEQEDEEVIPIDPKLSPENENVELSRSESTDTNSVKSCKSENVENNSDVRLINETENRILEQKTNNENGSNGPENSENKLLNNRTPENETDTDKITSPLISSKNGTSRSEETIRKNGLDETESNEKTITNGTSYNNQEYEKKNLSPLVHNQVECVNLHCQSGYNLAEAPLFVLTYFGVERRKNVLQKACLECFNLALEHQEKLCSLLKNNVPLVTAEFPSQKDDVVVMDSVEEIYEEEVLPNAIIEMVEKDLLNLMKDAVEKYNLNYQLEVAEDVLTKKYDDLIVKGKELTDELTLLDNQLKDARKEIYKHFTPRFKNLQPLNIYESGEKTKRNNAGETPKRIQAGEAPKKIQPGETPKRIQAGETPRRSNASEAPKRSQVGEAPRRSLVGEAPRRSLVGELPRRSQPGEAPKTNNAGAAHKSSTPIEKPKRSNPIKKTVEEVRASLAKQQLLTDEPAAESNDVVALKQVEIPNPSTLPPIGKLTYPLLYIGASVYVMKASFFGVWLRAKIIDLVYQQENAIPSYRVRLECAYRAGHTKVVTGKQIAYVKPSKTRLPVGTRVIALFRNSEAPGKDAYYAGIIAEPPKILNKFRYLVFFDDGYAQYVPHEKILLVCEYSKFVYEDVHPDSREFIKSYLDQYPERPMVKLQKGQIVKTEWNGKWWIARVVAVDGSLAKMHFDADNRTEWIYRGSTRLGPLYSEMIAAAARKEQGALSRHRSLGIASLKKRNMPYVEYSVDQDDVKATQTSTPSKNVAKKSTASRASSQMENFSDRPARPLKPNEKVEYTTKGYNRTISLSGRIKGRKFARHQCCFSCIEWVKFDKKKCIGINPLAVPLLYGFERQFAIFKNKKTVFYRAPCGRRLRNIEETYRYLRLTKSLMGLDYFDFDPRLRALQEFHLESNMYCTIVKDISYGHENTPVSCVNEINHTWPSFMDYSTRRIPQEGVNICLDEEFLVCCSCTDDCQNKEKCECWQLTIEGTKLGPTGQVDPSAGYYYKRLLEPVTTGIYECNNRCKCGVTCLNRVAQYPLQLNLQVFKTLRKGWGLRTLNDIPQGGFICIYAGRLHTEQGANDDGRMYGDEYLAELDYIEVVERFKEGYESEVIEPEEGNNTKKSEEEGDDCPDEQDLDESQMNSDDMDYVPEGLSRIPHTENVVTTRNRNRKVPTEEKSESEGEKDKEEDTDNDKESIGVDDDDDEMKKKPSKFSADMLVNKENPPKYKSVREMFGDGADDCYIMDAKSCGNIGRYLNHSCQPNVFVQNVFVDTHDVRFPWVAFFALTYIKAGTELTWDYNYDIGSVPGKVLYCYCNSSECRGRLL